MKIHITNSSFLGNINNFLSYFDSSEPNKLEITANKDWISIHPLPLCMIAALGRSVGKENIVCEPIVARSGHYLSVMGLFDFIGITDPVLKTTERHELSGRAIPLRAIKTNQELNEFLKDLVPLLHLKDKPQYVSSIQHIFSELIRNVLEHAKSEHGAVVCAQYFAKTNRIAIGIADLGIGLKKSLSESHKVRDDEHAVQLALTPGITGTTSRIGGGSLDNGGLGLFLIKSIAFVNEDFFNIISGEVMYKLLKRKERKIIKLSADPFKDRHNKSKIPAWNGVAVGVDLCLTDTKEFKTLLSYIYTFYQKSMKETLKSKYKKPKFI